MKKVKDFKTFYEAIQGDFSDYISSIKLYLKKRDKEYKKYLDTMAEIQEKNRKIDLLASGKIMELTKEDVKDLQKVIGLQYKVLGKEEKAIFYGGVGNAIWLLREMDSLKKFESKIFLATWERTSARLKIDCH